MSKNLRCLALLVATSVLLIGCSDPPASGVVTSREYHEPYSWVQMTCAAYNKGVCTVWVPITHHVAERWTLCLRAGDENGCRDVDRATYDEFLVGEYYPGEPS